jgi:hypothetical protein
MSTRILHIIDDAKFINYCKGTYEINDYINKYESFDNVQLDSLVDDFDIIIIHFLRTEYAPLFINDVFPTNRIIWTLWGADCFSLGKFFNPHLMPKTRLARLKTSFRRGISFGLKISIKYLFPTLFDKQNLNQGIIDIITKVKNIIVLMPADADEVRLNYPTKAAFFHLNYVDPLLASENLSFDYNNGNNILVGNSAAFTNNHIDALEVLRKEALEDLRLLIPLNYGDMIYGDIVEEFVNDKFGKKAVCLREFLSFGIYVEMLETCELAIMPHIRQQAIGNIVKLLLQGTHIYFHPKSSIYQFLSKEGFVVATLHKLTEMRKLSLNEKKINQALTLSVFGKQEIHSKVNAIISQVLSMASER